MRSTDITGAIEEARNFASSICASLLQETWSELLVGDSFYGFK